MWKICEEKSTFSKVLDSNKKTNMLFKILKEIPDKRRAQWRQFWLGEILFFSVLGILSWANSYRKINLFIKNHFNKLDKKYNLKWKNIPSYCTIRLIIQQADATEL
jgi:hypothetical protein